MIARLIDSMVGAISPAWGTARIADRLQYRATLESIEQLAGNVQTGYDGAKLNRLLRFVRNTNENAVDAGSLERLEARARDLWRNNPAARKLVRQITVKTIGQGLRPISQATTAGGQPHVAFRKRCREVWQAATKELDSRGRPGYGGDTFTDQCKTALAAVVRGGNVLARSRFLTDAERRSRGLLLPLQLQLVDAGRLDHSKTSQGANQVFRGIEFDGGGQRVAYHVLPYHPSDPRGFYSPRPLLDPVRFPADSMLHVFVTEDVDQVLGASWFAPILALARDVGDYEYSELKAAAMGACVVASIKRQAGQGRFGLQSTSGDLEDEAGNRITRLQPGMLLDNVDIEGFNPQRPNARAADFVAHLLRSIASGLPGMKGSTLTNDYRGSSFASERSADNEVWPEIFGVQDWWGCSFNTPVYEQVVITAVLAGRFDDVISTAEFLARRQDLLAVGWQGPVPKSINPKDDEQAAQLGRANLTSSVQAEAAKKGVEAFQVLQDLEDYVASVQATGLPDDAKEQLILLAMGVPAQQAAMDEASSAGDGSGGGGTGADGADAADEAADDRQLRFLRRAEQFAGGAHAAA